jgi:hypothetical protein
MIGIFYKIIVLYGSLHLIWYLFRQRKFWNQASAVLVLTLFVLRLFGIK